jgi:hypothetical protein
MPSLVTEFLIFTAHTALVIGLIETSITLGKELIKMHKERKNKQWMN